MDRIHIVILGKVGVYKGPFELLLVDEGINVRLVLAGVIIWSRVLAFVESYFQVIELIGEEVSLQRVFLVLDAHVVGDATVLHLCLVVEVEPFDTTFLYCNGYSSLFPHLWAIRIGLAGIEIVHLVGLVVSNCWVQRVSNSKSKVKSHFAWFEAAFWVQIQDKVYLGHWWSLLQNHDRSSKSKVGNQYNHENKWNSRTHIGFEGTLTLVGDAYLLSIHV